MDKLEALLKLNKVKHYLDDISVVVLSDNLIEELIENLDDVQEWLQDVHTTNVDESDG